MISSVACVLQSVCLSPQWQRNRHAGFSRPIAHEVLTLYAPHSLVNVVASDTNCTRMSQPIRFSRPRVTQALVMLTCIFSHVMINRKTKIFAAWDSKGFRNKVSLLQYYTTIGEITIAHMPQHAHIVGNTQSPYEDAKIFICIKGHTMSFMSLCIL